MEVYLDNSATTRVFPEVAELMKKIMCEDYGNPSSLHMKGVQAENHLRYAKETMARLLKVNEKDKRNDKSAETGAGYCCIYRTGGRF